MMNDEMTTLGELRRLVARFVAQRRWQVYHTPKSLSMSIAIEAAELMEQFQWQGNEESRRAAGIEAVRSAVADELADVLIYCLALANVMGLDVSRAVVAKMARNDRRFPPGVRPSSFDQAEAASDSDKEAQDDERHRE